MARLKKLIEFWNELLINMLSLFKILKLKGNFSKTKNLAELEGMEFKTILSNGIIKGKKDEKAAMLIKILLAVSLSALAIFLMTLFYNRLYVVKQRFSKISDAIVIEQPLKNKLNVKDGYMLLTYSIRINKAQIIDKNNWHRLYNRLPMESKKYDDALSVYNIYGFITYQEAKKYIVLLENKKIVAVGKGLIYEPKLKL